jgi:hypothetical protein
MKQHSLALLTYDGMKKRAKREKFLNEMEQAAPWERFLDLIEPHYPKAGKGRQPMGLGVMIRIYCYNYGTACPTRVQKKPCMTAEPCTALLGWS